MMAGCLRVKQFLSLSQEWINNACGRRASYHTQPLILAMTALCTESCSLNFSCTWIPYCADKALEIVFLISHSLFPASLSPAPKGEGRKKGKCSHLTSMVKISMRTPWAMHTILPSPVSSHANCPPSRF